MLHNILSFSMKTRTYLSILWFILFFLQCNLKANPTPEHTNLLAYDWVNHPVYFYLNTTVDTISAKRIPRLETLLEKKGIISTLIPTYQTDKTSTILSVRIKYKTESTQNLSIVITSIGECENTNSADTIQLRTAEDWEESAHMIKIKETPLINISIEAAGYKENSARIWISDFEILIDGNEIPPPSENRKGSIHLTKGDIIHWNKESHPSLPFWKHRILGIGETVHGTKTMNDIAIAVLKERILKHECNIILFEIPLEFSFYINRYVKNDANFNLEDISAYFDSYLYADTILSFIRWIKEYNLTCDEKVSVWGFDINFVQLKSRIDLFNYFYSLNAGKHIKELDTVCELLLDTNIPFEKILLMFDECPDLADALNEDELKLMLHCIKITQQNSSSYYRFINRDNMMNEVTTFIIDNFGKKNKTITLYGHFGHLNYINGQGPIVMNYYSLGHYMKNKYKDDYACVALITNQGSAMLIKSYTEMEISTLSSAPQGSLEYQLNRFKEDSVYLSMNNLDCSNILKLRLIGNKELTEQFRYIAPKARMDGVLFIKESQSISKGNKNQNKKINYNFVIMKAFQEALKKIKNK